MSNTTEERERALKIRKYVSHEASEIAAFSQVSARGHFTAAERWTDFHLWLGIPTAIMAAVAGASALSQFDFHNIIAAFLAIIVTTLTAVATFLNPSEKAYSHTNAGNKYLSISNEARIFSFIDCFQEENIEELTDQLKELTKRRNELNENSPLIPSWAYEKARKRYEKARSRGDEGDS